MAGAVDFDARKIDSIFRHLDQCHSPGAAVGVALHGKPIYRRAFGLAHMELPVVLGPSMRMRIGSTSKHFTSLAYLLLCEEGRASLDDRVGKFIPELHPTARAVTMRQLMAHASGLRDVLEIAWAFSGSAPVASEELLDLYRVMDGVNSEPGAAWSYNNGGYLIVGAAIERITGRPLEDVFKERLFQPIGMFDTLLRRRDTDFIPNSATLHSMTPEGTFSKSYLGTALSGEGGIVSTVDDMLAWLAHMDSPHVGHTDTWAEIRKPFLLSNGTTTGYGLGLIVNRYRGLATVSHGGGVLGGNSQMMKLPALGLDIVVMLNRDDVSALRLANDVVDACIPGLPVETNPADLAIAEGVFRSPATGRVIQLFGRDGKQIVSIDGYDWPFVAESEGVLTPDPIWSYLKLRVRLTGEHGRPAAVTFDDFGNSDQLTRLEPAPSGEEGPAGRYVAASIGMEATVRVESGRTTLTAASRFGSHTYVLEPLSRRLWRARSRRTIPWDLVVFFPPGGHEFQLNSLRTRNLRFLRQS